MDTVTSKCPGCGSPLAFSIEKQLWACEFCKNEYTLEQLSPPPDIVKEPVHDNRDCFHNEVDAYRCSSCGAELMAEHNTAATICAYCGSAAILPTQLGGEVRKPNFILPFTLTKDAALGLLFKRCKSRPFVPRALMHHLKEGKITGLYVPFWLFSCDAQGYINGEGDIVTIWSDSKYDYRKTDTYRIVRGADMRIQHLPVDASNKMDDASMHAIEPFDYSQLKPFSIEYLSGHYADSYDMTPEQAIPQGERRMDMAVDASMRGTVSGYTSVRLNSTRVIKRSNELHYAMMPVWSFAYRYKNKIYSFTLNGQTGKLCGKLPVSVGKVFAWMGGLAALGLLISIFTI